MEMSHVKDSPSTFRSNPLFGQLLTFISGGLFCGAVAYVATYHHSNAAQTPAPVAAHVAAAPAAPVAPAPVAPAPAPVPPPAQPPTTPPVALSQNQETPALARETYNNGVAAVLSDGKDKILVIKAGQVLQDPKPDFQKVCILLNNSVTKRPDLFPVFSLLRTIVQDHGTQCTFPNDPIPTKEEMAQLAQQQQRLQQQQQSAPPAPHAETTLSKHLRAAHH